MTDEEAPEATPDENEADPTPVVSPAEPSRRRFRAATDDELDPQSFMVENERAAVRIRIHGGSVTTDRGDASFIGGVMQQAARVVGKAAEQFRVQGAMISNPQLKDLRFGHSVVICFEISPGENVQLDFENRRSAPTIEAARAVRALLSSAPEEVLPAALSLGPDVVAAYKQLLNHLAEDEVTLEWQVADEPEIASVTSIDARQDYAILVREGEREEHELTIAGRLTMADAELHQFKLTLPAGASRPPWLKGKHKVSGTFSESMGRELKQLGLWDADVMATLKIVRDVSGTTATPRDSQHELLEARRLDEAQTGLF